MQLQYHDAGEVVTWNVLIVWRIISVMKRQRTVGQNDCPQNLIAVKDVSTTYLNYLLTEAGEMKSLVLKTGGDERLKHKILASVFYEVTAFRRSFTAVVSIPIVKRIAADKISSLPLAFDENLMFVPGSHATSWRNCYM